MDSVSHGTTAATAGRQAHDDHHQYYPPPSSPQPQLSAFGNSSIDHKLVTAARTTAIAKQHQLGFDWKDVVDEEGRWSVDLKRHRQGRHGLRRCRVLLKAGTECKWTTSTGERHGHCRPMGLVTVPKLIVEMAVVRFNASGSRSHTVIGQCDFLPCGGVYSGFAASLDSRRIWARASLQACSRAKFLDQFRMFLRQITLLADVGLDVVQLDASR
jgi:hypothetical protein